jgi:hypothetical protein
VGDTDGSKAEGEMQQVDSHDYTTSDGILQVRQDFTYTWAKCPKCDSPMILNDPAHIGGHGTVRTWECGECGHWAIANYSEYSAMFDLFTLSHNEQRRVVGYVLAGFPVAEAIEHGVAEAAAQDHKETTAIVMCAMAGR